MTGMLVALAVPFVRKIIGISISRDRQVRLSTLDSTVLGAVEDRPSW